jgi:hypothetical protein
MNKRSVQTMRCALLLAIGLAVAGCEKIGGSSLPEKAAAIPASFGELVAVTPTDRRLQSVLWFKQQDQTIVAVLVDLRDGRWFVYKTKFPRAVEREQTP